MAVNKKLTAVMLCACMYAGAHGYSVLGIQYPFGLSMNANTGGALAMGGTGAGINRAFNSLLLNPANLGFIDRTVFSSLVLGDYAAIEENGSHSSHFTMLPLQLSAGFPLGQFGVLGFSFEKGSDASVKYLGPLNSISKPFPMEQRISLARYGGLRSWNAGYGISPNKYISLGVSYSRSYYSIRNSPIVAAVIDSSLLILARDSSALHATFNGFGAGVMIPLGDLSIGVGGDYFFKTRGRMERGLYTNSEYVKTIQKPEPEPLMQLPPSVKTGLSYEVTREWLVGSDAALTLWDYYHNESAATNNPPQRTVSVSVGGQYVPALQLIKYRYLETLQYRAGVRYAQLPAGGNSEYALSAGIGLPLDKGNGLFDIAVELGIRKDNARDDYAEKFVHIGIGINGGRKWTRNIEDTY